MATIKVLFVYPNLYMMNLVPPVIGVFSALLKREGHTVALFDTTYYQGDAGFDSDKKKMENLQVRPFNLEEKGIRPKNTDMYADFDAMVKEYQPDLIAMSVVEDVWDLGLSLLKRVRHYRIPTVVGGVFPTFAPEIIIREDAVDMVCVGEGESLLVELCNMIGTGKDFSRIPNLWVKKDGQVVRNPMRERINLDDLPMPDYSLFEENRLYRPMAGKVYRMLPVETHRGCPYTCHFCNSPAQQTLYRNAKAGSYFRKKSVGKILDEMRMFVAKYKLEYVYFTADTFLAWSEPEFDEFIELYAEFKLPFWMQTRVETITPEYMKKLKSVGIHRMSIGLEHGNEKFRRAVLKRNVSNEQIVRAFDVVADYAIPVSVNNITGFPDETREMAQDSIEINARVKTDTTNCYAFTPYHGTPLRAYAITKGYLKETDMTNALYGDPMLKMPNYPIPAIKGLMRTMPMYAKFPRDMWPKIERAEKFDAEGEAAFAELKKEFVARFFTGESVS